MPLPVCVGNTDTHRQGDLQATKAKARNVPLKVGVVNDGTHTEEGLKTYEAMDVNLVDNMV